MPTAAKLQVLLTANTKPFTKGLASAGNSLQRFVKDVAGFALSPQGALLGLGVAAGVAAKSFAGMVKSAFDAVDASARLADRLGVSTEALESFRFAARQAGEGTESIDNSLERFVRTLGEAASGGAAADAFATIGLNAERLAQGGVEEALLAVSDALAGVANPASRAALAVQFFGKAGQKILNVLSGGSARLQQFRADAERLGITFSRIDASQIDNAGDAVQRVWDMVRGLANEVARRLSPFIEAAANALVDFGTDGSRALNLIGIAFDTIAFSIGRAMDLIVVFGNDLKSVALEVIALWGGFIDLLGDKLEFVFGPRTNIDKFQEEVGKLILEANESQKQSDAALARIVSGESRFSFSAIEEFQRLAREAAENAHRPFVGPPAPALDLDAIGESAKAAAKDLEHFQSVADRIFQSTRTPIEEFTSSIEEALDVFARGMLDAETLIRQFDKAQAEFDKSNIRNAPRSEDNFFGSDIDTDRISIPGIGGSSRAVQQVQDPQLQTTNNVLRQIQNRLGKVGVAA